MKIAIPTLDGTSISQHFGRCKAFLVFEMEGTRILSRETRENAHGCSGHHGADHDPHHGHDHGGFVQMLGDCHSIIARGIGGGAIQSLSRAGIRVCTTQEACTAEEAAIRLASGTLGQGLGSTCACGHP